MKKAKTQVNKRVITFILVLTMTTIIISASAMMGRWRILFNYDDCVQCDICLQIGADFLELGPDEFPVVREGATIDINTGQEVVDMCPTSSIILVYY